MSQKIRKSLLSSSSSGMELLPWSVVEEEILPKLSAESLARFKFVSKFWKSLISSPRFIRWHFTHPKYCSHDNLNVPILRCFSKIDIYHEQELYFLLRGNQFIKLLDPPQTMISPTRHKYLSSRLIGSCNGIICFLAKTDPRFLKHEIILWNPSMQRKSLEIPLSLYLYDRSFFAEHLDFCGGLGYDAQNDDYKIVHISYCSRRKTTKPFSCFVNLYSIKARKWRVIDHTKQQQNSILSDDHIVEFGSSSQTCADGKRVHWLVSCEMSRWKLASFDMSDEIFDQMTLPDSVAMADWKQHVELASLVGESLTLFVYDSKWSTRTDYVVWVMKEYGVADSWTKQKISFGEPGKPLGFLNNGKNEFLFLQSGKLVSYDNESRRKTYFGIEGVSIMSCLGTYMESLVKLQKQVCRANMMLINQDIPDHHHDHDHEVAFFFPPTNQGLFSNSYYGTE